jgi:hypothetical protein
MINTAGACRVIASERPRSFCATRSNYRLVSLPDRFRTVAAVVVYWTAIALGGSVLLADPATPLVAVPVLGGAAVVAHAARADRLVALGYAVGTMWLAVLALSVGTGVVDVLTLPDGAIAPLADRPRVAALGTVGLVGVLVVAYGAFGRRSAERSRSESD